jgi:phosphoribosylanthranilate isomerase
VAARAGADFLGLNFCPASSRYVGDGDVAALLAAAEPPAVPVAVTVNPTKKLLEQLTRGGGLIGPRPFPVIQLHGNEPASLADWLIDRGTKVIKAFHVAGPEFSASIDEWLGKVKTPSGLLAILLDTAAAPGVPPGGTGRRFNWKWIAQAREDGLFDEWPPLMLAGGLSPSNITKAVRIARPWGVDVASGVEVEDSPGVKSIDRIRDFVRNARVGGT